MKASTYALAGLLLLSSAACRKSIDLDSSFDIKVQLSFADKQNEGKLPISDIKLTLLNLQNNATTTLTNLNALTSIDNLTPGNYDISATVTYSREDYLKFTGEDPGSAISFNYAFKNRLLNKNEILDLSLIAGSLGDFVIKQIYYAGSDTKEGAVFRDQFIEIYNNTDQVLYADSLYIARFYGRQSMTTKNNYFQANEQYDWSKSEGMLAGLSATANSNYAYARELVMIPGNGKTYPVQPGKSIVVAQTALNHKAPFTGSNGKEVTILNPSLTVDLSKADFEAYYANLPNINPLPSDIDNPNVPNLDVLETSGRDMIFDNPGRDAFGIFKGKTREEVKALGRYAEPTIASPSASAKRYVQIPTAWLMDAVEIQPNVPTSRLPKKLWTAQDAGFTFAQDGSYSSQSVIRKTAYTSNGRKVLKDTNNSSEDFVSIKANPGGFAD